MGPWIIPKRSTKILPPAFSRPLGSYPKPPDNGCCIKQQTRYEIGLGKTRMGGAQYLHQE